MSRAVADTTHKGGCLEEGGWALEVWYGLNVGEILIFGPKNTTTQTSNQRYGHDSNQARKQSKQANDYIVKYLCGIHA